MAKKRKSLPKTGNIKQGVKNTDAKEQELPTVSNKSARAIWNSSNEDLVRYNKSDTSVPPTEESGRGLLNILRAAGMSPLQAVYVVLQGDPSYIPAPLVKVTKVVHICMGVIILATCITFFLETFPSMSVYRDGCTQCKPVRG